MLASTTNTGATTSYGGGGGGGGASTTTYTSIPISVRDVISRSIHNLSTFLSRSRPWPEFLSVAGSIDFPSSISATSHRLRLNSKYFAVNYAVLVATCASVSLIGSPISLIIVGLVFSLWLILYFFREDPMIILGRQVSNQFVLLGLVLGSVATIWFTNTLNNLLIGSGVGLLICAIHGGLKNPEGLFLDENDAVSHGLISPKPGHSSHNNGGISSV